MMPRYIITGIGTGFNFHYNPAMILKGNLSSAKASLIRKLHQRKHREQTGLFLAEGVRTVEQILANRNVITEFIVRRSGSTWEFDPSSVKKNNFSESGDDDPDIQNKPGLSENESQNTRPQTSPKTKSDSKNSAGSNANLNSESDSESDSDSESESSPSTSDSSTSTPSSTSEPQHPTPYTLHPKKLLSFFETSIYEADATLFNELSTVEHPQEIFSVCRIPQAADTPELLKGSGVLLAMYMMSDPGNLGTVLRSAAWFGVRGVFLSTGTVDLYNPKVIRSMAGSVGSLPVATGYLAIFLEEAKKSGWKIYLLDAGEHSAGLASIRPGKKSILVLGSEAHGLPDAIKSSYTCIEVESPDRRPSVESLNASVTASIALYQLSLKAGLKKRE